MYYDDEARTFNLISGLLFGGLLGAGATLLLLPRSRRPPLGRRKRRRWLLR
jgi:gas vesicle protein